MQVLKETEALDEKTAAHIPAEVIEDGGQIYLRKNDELILIETDAYLYKLISNKGSKKKEPHHLVLEANYNCNLACASCFSEVEREAKPVPLEEIRKKMSPYQGKIVSIAGGEPTLNKDIFEIIRIVNEKNTASLTTIGILLTNADFLKGLKRSGLKHITLSFNGTEGKIYEAVEGKDLLEKKLNAFENIKRKFNVMLSVLVVRNVNNHNLGEIIRMGIKNIDSVREIRLRSNSTIGKHMENPQYFLGEMLEHVCSQMGFSKEHIYRELEFKRQLSRYISIHGFLQKSCGFSFHVIKEGKDYFPMGKFLRQSRTPIDFMHNSLVLSRYIPYGDFFFKKLFGSNRSFYKRKNNLLKVSFRSWPGKKTLDVQEHYYLCGTHFTTGEKENTPTCYANIRRDIHKETYRIIQ